MFHDTILYLVMLCEINYLSLPLSVNNVILMERDYVTVVNHMLSYMKQTYNVTSLHFPLLILVCLITPFSHLHYN